MAVVVICGALTALNSSPAMALPYVRRVNVPYVNGTIPMTVASVFWLGHVTPSDNYADVRMAYNDTELYVHVAVMDRRLWYDPAHSINTLTNWDSVTLYLDKAGRTGVTPDANSYQFIGQLNDLGAAQRLAGCLSRKCRRLESRNGAVYDGNRLSMGNRNDRWN